MTLRSKILLAGFFAGTMLLYFWGAMAHGRRVNTDSTSFDQLCGIAMKMKLDGYSAPTNRNQMPVFPFYLSLFYVEGMSEEDFFQRAKIAAIALSAVLLTIIFLALLRTLPRHEAINIFLIVVFTIYVFRAPYCQAEPLYYALCFLAFLAMGRAIVSRHLPLAIAVGILSAVAWLTKASFIPAVALFLTVLFARAAVNFYRGDRTSAGRSVAGGIFSVAVFLLLLSPYLATSKRLYGSWFYNQNTHFYVWHDSWRESRVHERSLAARGYQMHQPPENEKMGPLPYLRTHNLGSIARRVALGSVETILVAALSFGYFEYALGYVLLLMTLALWQRRRFLAAARENIFLTVFVLAFLGGQFLLCAFYVPIAPGPRFALALYLPFMVTAAKAARKLGEGLILPLGVRRLPVLPMFNTFVSVVIALDIVNILARGLFTMPGGG